MSSAPDTRYQPSCERTISDLVEIIESAYGFDSDDGELCDCPEWQELKRRILDVARAGTEQ